VSTLLEVRDLEVHFPVRGDRKTVIKAVNGVSFSVDAGKSFGIVGESGCGKTTTARAIIRLYRPVAGSVFFAGKDIVRISGTQAKAICREIQMVFQDPYASLDPRMTVEDIIMEPLIVHRVGTRKSQRERVEELLRQVGLDLRLAKRYPHEFSGGQRQRIGIARALALHPKLIILDEPVSALDVSVQSQILNLLQTLQDEMGLTYLFISHNLSVVDYICDEIAVMYFGRIVEQASRADLFHNPRHPYTKALLSAIPAADISRQRKKIILEGDLPSPAHPPGGCAFHPRCRYTTELCRRELPPAAMVRGSHRVFCWNYDKTES
jgi:oligopeptide/dipeptide ABC transporter ATP-binding protein